MLYELWTSSPALAPAKKKPRTISVSVYIILLLILDSLFRCRAGGLAADPHCRATEKYPTPLFSHVPELLSLGVILGHLSLDQVKADTVR